MSMKRVTSAPVRCITFDLTGTLYKFNRPVGTTYAQVAESMGYHVYTRNIDLMNCCFKQSWKEQSSSGPCYSINGQANERLWWRAVVRGTIDRFDHQFRSNLSQIDNSTIVLPSLLEREDTFERYFRAVYQVYGSRLTFDVYPDALHTLTVLRQQGILLGVVTNSPLRTVECTLPLLGLHGCFDFTLSCVDAGHMKPHPALFQLAVQSAQDCLLSRTITYDSVLRPEEFLHVGDEVVADYDGARAAGMQAVLIDRNHNNSNIDHRNNTISSLSDLLSIIRDCRV